MLTIKKMSDIETLKREAKLPKSLVHFLAKTFIELHVAYESEVNIDQFTLEMYGPIYVLEANRNKTENLKQIGFQLEENRIGSCQPEWVEKINLEDLIIWRIGVMTDNDYFFQIILPINELGTEVDSWLEKLSTQ